ncbi:siderophore-interacting protein [Micromonospora sonneratiae]|uniref:Siderophore-interacting protein n=1 Tax=Micromonospora sonneratiae TaxID=1184706 RepID=A0ABW3YS99_9ACTN
MTVPTREIKLVRHDLTPRLLEVSRVTRITPRMARVTLTGEALDGLAHAAPDDHVKVFFPQSGERLPVMPTLGPNGIQPTPAGQPLPTFRDYTIRYVRPEQREVDIDFALHGHGPGGTWAAQASPGDVVGMLGPRGSHLNPLNFDWYLLAGDETALPAIGAWLEQLPAGVPAYVFVEVADKDEEQPLQTAADARVVWLHRDDAEGRNLLEEAIREIQLPGGDGYVWVAGEAGNLKPIRRYLRGLGLPREWVEVDGYWKRGVVNLDHHAADDDE